MADLVMKNLLFQNGSPFLDQRFLLPLDKQSMNTRQRTHRLLGTATTAQKRDAPARLALMKEVKR